ncbi:MAG: hypothetical protein PV344_07130, partial [Anaplasma sp.]|nr:hypothetical protein [Anaplasma sp.]
RRRRYFFLFSFWHKFASLVQIFFCCPPSPRQSFVIIYLYFVSPYVRAMPKQWKQPNALQRYRARVGERKKAQGSRF